MRDIPVGNGRLLVNFDDKYQIRDIYFPHAGQENHTEGFAFRFGVWADGDFSWVSADGWERDLRYLSETLVTEVTLRNQALGVEISCNDTVASHEDIFLRRIRVSNLWEKERDIRVFLHHDFRIYESNVGDTAFYDPETLSLIHYKKDRYFLVNTEPHFSSFATGRKGTKDKKGTWIDAEDGHLQGGAMTEGSVDSTIGIHFGLGPTAVHEFHYWIAAGKSHSDVESLNAHVLHRRPEQYLGYTANYWCAWVNKNDTDLSELPPEIADFYKRCLLITHTQIDYHGAILAANDSDVTERATDHYSYLWTRDGAFVANALDMAGFSSVTRAFYDLCSRIVHPGGYFLQKYNPDGTVASGWHAAWDIAGKQRLVPIQEDETALVLWAFWHHYNIYRDIEFSHRIYRRMVISCADFMVAFRDDSLNLPKPSWNLWENQRGIHTFTCATVVAGLRAAAKFARLFAEPDRADVYESTAAEMVEAMREHLYSREKGRFLRALHLQDDRSLVPDTTVDASLFATFYFECFAPDDEMVAGTMASIIETLAVRTHVGGIARFENDDYVRVAKKATGNPWFICTLWLADYYIAAARSAEDLEKALEILTWTVDRALPSGVLAEQLNPLTGEHVSVSPLTWAHSTFVATVINYLKKLRQFADQR